MVTSWRHTFDSPALATCGLLNRRDQQCPCTFLAVVAADVCEVREGWYNPAQRIGGRVVELGWVGIGLADSPGAAPSPRLTLSQDVTTSCLTPKRALAGEPLQ